MEKRALLYDGTAKRIYATDDDQVLCVSYKDIATDSFGLKMSTIAGKGGICNRVSNHLMTVLEKAGIATHFLTEISETDCLVRRVKIIPLAVIVRNISAGAFATRYGVEEGIVFDEPTIEFYLKNDLLGDPLINTYHAVALKIESRERIEEMKALAFRINSILKEYFRSVRIHLVDFRLEFGLMEDGTLVLADEISPDTCRLWDIDTHFRLDKDRFRLDMEQADAGYHEILRRLLGNT